MSPKAKALIALLVVSVFWSTSGALTKLLLASFQPIPLVMLRLFFSSLVILPLLFLQKIHNWKRFFCDVLPVSLFGMGNFLLFVFGVGRTTGNASAIIYAITPILTAVTSTKIIAESSSRTKIIGILIGLVGAITILLLPLIERGQGIMSGDALGNLMILGGVVLWSGYNIGSRYLTVKKQYSPIAIAASMILISFVCFLFLSIVTNQMNILIPLTTGNNFPLVLFLAFFVTVLTFIVHQYVIKHTSATTATFTNYLTPVFAFAFDALLLGEVLTPGFFAGSLLVFAGVFVATSTKIVNHITRQFA